jgi:hypothetical protein
MTVGEGGGELVLCGLAVELDAPHVQQTQARGLARARAGQGQVVCGEPDHMTLGEG